MALQNLHEMIRNLSAYIKNLESLCENGIRLAKNFERLLSPGPVPSSSSLNLDSDLLAQNQTWELAQKIYQCWTMAHKVATSDSNALISEILPMLQDAVQSAMKDPDLSLQSNTYEVFRSCFSAFFQIQWRFCSLYLQCTSSQSHYGSGFPRTPDLARSPTTVSFSSSSGGDRRESTESCMSSFSLPFSNPRSSFSSVGLSALSSRSSSPSPQVHHNSHHYGHHSRSRNSSPSVKFTPSQPPSPYGDCAYPYLFRRWSAHTHNYNANNTSSLSSGPSASSNLSGVGNYSSSGSIGSGMSGGLSSFSNSRRWSVPASSGIQAGSSSTSPFKSSWNEPQISISTNLGICGHTDSTRRGGAGGGKDVDYDYGLLDVINLLSTKAPNPVKMLAEEPNIETIDEFCSLENTTSLWPPSETENLPEIVLTTCGGGSDPTRQQQHVENMLSTSQRSSQSLRVPFSGDFHQEISPSHPAVSSISGQIQGEYALFPVTRSPTQGT